MCLLGPETTPNPNGTRPRYHDVVIATGEPEPSFCGAGHWRSRLRGTPPFAKNFVDPGDWPPPAARLPSVYDTWSTHFENDGVNQDFMLDQSVDEGTDGFDNGNGVDDDGDGRIDEDGPNGVDDDGDGATDEDDPTINWIVDDVEELETRPPYPVPLRGIQVKIRVFEPESRQVREVTIVQDFLPK
jgi:hypothetical protein